MRTINYKGYCLGSLPKSGDQYLISSYSIKRMLGDRLERSYKSIVGKTYKTQRKTLCSIDVTFPTPRVLLHANEAQKLFTAKL